jgi:UDP:flavonoid glycosyltransferase YjiC (YdhE family)
MVAAGLTEDKRFVAQRLAWSGAGINLNTSRPGESQIRTAVREVLHDSCYRRKAGALGQQMKRYNALEAVERAVNSLTLTKRIFDRRERVCA